MRVSEEWMETLDRVACRVGWWLRDGAVNSEQRRKPKNANKNMDSRTLSMCVDR